ncbi:hypothetical protein FA10DRAFT_263762 [Acaromyces ingoldii]|uniref:Uncharacterized protein n=1 Tax=Acaromyces ingoldii TaxID=215250 RepID=A0A316YYY3_9BASI|nr:hypothetical protein FA10DRAFT_263762 [Acaromyces ingoldii]PWN93055.1 hypothetical protein FA10DRAFT_263762 [Acaromyces ingoldii]
MSQSLVSAPAMLANGSEPHHSSPRAKSSPLVRTSSSSSAASPKGAASSSSSSSPPPPPPPPSSSASRAAKLVASPSLSQPTVSSQQVHAHRQQQQQQQAQSQAQSQAQPNGLTAIKATSNGVPSFPSPPSSSSSPPPSSSGPPVSVKLLTQPSVQWPYWLSEPVSALAKDIEQDMLEIESPPPFPLAIVFQHHERPGQAPAQTTLAQRDGLTLRISDFCHEAGYREWSRLMEVAPLASQHHMSRYNQLKFGCNGSPFTYVPMTLQSPSQSKAAMDRQLDNERRALDWLVEKRKRARQVAARARQEQQELARAKSRQSRDHGPMSPESESTTIGGLKRRSSNAVASLLSDSDGDSHMRGTSPFSTATAATMTTTTTATPVTSLPSGSSSLHDNNTVKIKGPVNDVETVAAEWEKPVGNELAYQQQPANASAVSTSGAVAAQIEPTTLQQVQEEQRPATISAMAPQQQQALAVKTSDTHPIQ